jgi:alpha-tubulin suppressor-like RCC1 family protein
MPLTKITGNVIKDGTLKPEDFSPGVPLWNETGYLSATKFYGSGLFLSGITAIDVNSAVINALTSTSFSGYLTADAFIGDGSFLTNIQKGLSVVEITDINFTIEPRHNNTVILLNNISAINIDVSVDPLFALGHRTVFIQNNTGRGKFISPQIYNADNFYETNGQYSVSELLNYGQFGLNWTLYGDLTSTSLTAAPLPVTTTPQSSGFTNIQISRSGAIALSSNNSVFIAGSNEFGKIGQNKNSVSLALVNLFTQILSAQNDSNIITNVKFNKIAAGTTYYMALSNTDLYGVGFSSALGLNQFQVGESRDKSLFTKISFPANAQWSNITCGHNHSLALSGTDLYATGANSVGQLGLNSATSRSTFTKVTFPADAKWDAVFAFEDSSWALSGGDLYACGEDRGRLGIDLSFPVGDNRNYRSTFTKVTRAIDGGTIINNPKFVNIFPSLDHCLALSATLSGFQVFATQNRGGGNLNMAGLVPNQDTTLFTRIASPAASSCLAAAAVLYGSFVLSGTDLYSVGFNNSGVLGHNDTATRSTFTKITIPVNAKWTSIFASGREQFAYALSGSALYGVGDAPGFAIDENRLTFTQITAVAIPQ